MAANSAGVLIGSGASVSMKVELKTDFIVMKRLVEAVNPKRMNSMKAKKFRRISGGKNFAMFLNSSAAETAEPIIMKGSIKIRIMNAARLLSRKSVLRISMELYLASIINCFMRIIIYFSARVVKK